jgi:hypothetical protein
MMKMINAREPTVPFRTLPFISALSTGDQQYPPGTQNNYVGFLKLFVVTETGKELNSPKGGKGS